MIYVHECMHAGPHRLGAHEAAEEEEEASSPFTILRNHIATLKGGTAGEEQGHTWCTVTPCALH